MPLHCEKVLLPFPSHLGSVAKSFVNNKPLTRVSITGEGRRAFAAYLDAIGALIGGKD